jgi:phosphotransferase system HPr (HPr) family protein
MTKAEITIRNPLGIHARVAFQLAETGRQFKSDILVSNDMRKGDGKDIMEILTLCAGPGTVLKVEANGVDEGAAVEAIVKMLKSVNGS